MKIQDRTRWKGKGLNKKEQHKGNGKETRSQRQEKTSGIGTTNNTEPVIFEEHLSDFFGGLVFCTLLVSVEQSRPEGLGYGCVCIVGPRGCVSYRCSFKLNETHLHAGHYLVLCVFSAYCAGLRAQGPPKQGKRVLFVVSWFACSVSRCGLLY